MTIDISAGTRRVVYTGSAGLGPYTFAFELLNEDDIAVYFNTTLLTKTSDYTVTFTSGTQGAGSVTIVLGGNVSATPTSSDTITLLGKRAIERTTDFVTAGDLRAAALNEEFDAQVVFSQQIDEKVDRSLKGNLSDPTTLDYTLPSVDNRKGKYLAFNSTTGAPEAGASTDDVNTLSDITDDIATLADIEDGTDATDAIQTVAGIAPNVTTVAGISGNVTTVAGNTTNINTVAGNTTNINTVAGDTTDINALSAVSTEIGLLGNASVITDMSILGTADVVADMNTLGTADVVADMNTLGTADVVADMNTLATADIVADMDTLANISTDITAVADISTEVTAVAGDATDIGTVAGISANVTTVAGISPNVTTVAGISSQVTTVAGDSTDIQTVAGDSSDIQTVAGNTTNINTVAGANTNISTVATNIANVNTTAANITGVNSFAERYRVEASDPTTSLDEGDLVYNTTDNAFKFYDGTSWNAVNVEGIDNIVEDTTPQLGGNLDLNSNDVTGTGNFNITGNFALSGTVDGRDVATDGAKLDGIEAGATADQTKSDIDALGIDAATLDGIDSASFLRSDADDSVSANISFGDNNQAIFGAGNDLKLYSSGINAIALLTHPANLVISKSGGDNFVTIGSATAGGTGLKLDSTTTGGSQFIDGVNTSLPLELKHGGTSKFSVNSSGVSVASGVDFSADGFRKIKRFEYSASSTATFVAGASDSADVQKMILAIGERGTNGGPYSPSIYAKNANTLYTSSLNWNGSVPIVDSSATSVYAMNSQDLLAALPTYHTPFKGIIFEFIKTDSDTWACQGRWRTGDGSTSDHYFLNAYCSGPNTKIGAFQIATNSTSYSWSDLEVAIWEFY